MTRTTHRLLTIAAGLALAVIVALVILPAAAVAGVVATILTLGGVTAFGMIIDDRSEFADATTLPTAGTGRALVGDVMDLGTASGGGIGANIDKPIYLVISVDTTVTSAGAATVAFEVSSDAQAAIAVDGTASVHFRSAAFPKATLVAGFQFVIPVPPPPPIYERFLGVVQDVGTAALTAGKVNAFLTMSPPVWTARPDALP